MNIFEFIIPQSPPSSLGGSEQSRETPRVGQAGLQPTSGQVDPAQNMWLFPGENENILTVSKPWPPVRDYKGQCAALRVAESLNYSLIIVIIELHDKSDCRPIISFPILMLVKY